MAEEKSYKIEIEHLGRDAEGRIQLRARAVELEQVGGEQRPVALKLEGHYRFKWHVEGAEVEPLDEHRERIAVRIDPRASAPHVRAELISIAGETGLAVSESLSLARHGPGGGPRPTRFGGGDAVSVRLTRTQQGLTRDLILWIAIRYSTESIQFPNYYRFLEYVLCGDPKALEHDEFLDTDEERTFTTPAHLRQEYDRIRKLVDTRATLGQKHIPLTGVDAYEALREATEWFLKIYCGVHPPAEDYERIQAELVSRVGSGLEEVGDGSHRLRAAWRAYTANVNGVRMLPYLAIVRRHLADQSLPGDHEVQNAIVQCTGLIRSKLAHPCFVELIWSYWQEEGMLVQTINAIANRFQNRRRNGERDPLANLEIDSLRPLNNLLWGYVQGDLGRLSVMRRTYEYEHAYGLRLQGRAVGELRTADRRSKFVEAFHNFLLRCVQFYAKDDNTTIIADAFPVLNAIKEIHYLLAQGAHNQFGELPTTARAEMLIQQWLLARPEMREFLGTRPAVPYPQPWMDRIDSMKTLQGWTDTSVVHFNDLATFGEQILLGLRYGGWSIVNDPASAANFVRYWRPEIQGYVHAYLAVTGVDLGAEVTSQQGAEQRNLPPSVHLMRRLTARRAT